MVQSSGFTALCSRELPLQHAKRAFHGMVGDLGCGLRRTTPAPAEAVPAEPVAAEVDRSCGGCQGQNSVPALDRRELRSVPDRMAREHQESRMEVETKYGTMTLELFDDVPMHAANFRYKVERGYYRPSEFVRVVPDFVVQGGNSEDPRAQELRWLIGKHTLPSEFDDRYRHVRGAVAMGRTYKGNPDKRSASYDFTSSWAAR